MILTLIILLTIIAPILILKYIKWDRSDRYERFLRHCIEMDKIDREHKRMMERIKIDFDIMRSYDKIFYDNLKNAGIDAKE